MNYFFHPAYSDYYLTSVPCFGFMGPNERASLRERLKLSLSETALLRIQRYFLNAERRDPNIGELLLLNALSLHNDRLPHAYCFAQLSADNARTAAFQNLCAMRGKDAMQSPPTFADMMEACNRYLTRIGLHPHTQALYAGTKEELAALSGGSSPSLTLELANTSAVLLTSAVKPVPRHAALFLLSPSGTLPFADEISRFLSLYRAYEPIPLAVIGEEGLMAHLMRLQGVSIDTASLPGYDVTAGPASLLKAAKGSLLFAMPERFASVLYHLSLPLVRIGTALPNGVFQLCRGNIPLVYLDKQLLQSVQLPHILSANLATQEEKPEPLSPKYAQNNTDILAGVSYATSSILSPITFLADAVKHGANLHYATLCAVLEMPADLTATHAEQALSLLLDLHRTTAELSLPLVNPRQIPTDICAPRLTLFLSAKKAAPRQLPVITDFDTARSLLYGN